MRFGSSRELEMECPPEKLDNKKNLICDKWKLGRVHVKVSGTKVEDEGQEEERKYLPVLLKLKVKGRKKRR